MELKRIKRALIAAGLYRTARVLHRHLNKAAMDTYKTDKEFYSKLLTKPGALCFDVGANLGRISEVLLELGHKVIAFEPQPGCINEMKARCRPYKDRLHVEEMALGDASCTSTLHLRAGSGQSSLDSGWEGEAVGEIQVPVSTLDRAIQRFGVPLYIKIDVEGWELHVLKGLSQPIPIISFEYHQDRGLMEAAYVCLDHLRSFAKIEVNITPKERSQLALKEWLDPNEFKEAFQAKFLGDGQFLFGDLFVRTH